MERPVQKGIIYKKRIRKTEMWAKEMRTCNKNKSLFCEAVVKPALKKRRHSYVWTTKSEPTMNKLNCREHL